MKDIEFYTLEEQWNKLNSTKKQRLTELQSILNFNDSFYVIDTEYSLDSSTIDDDDIIYITKNLIAYTKQDFYELINLDKFKIKQTSEYLFEKLNGQSLEEQYEELLTLVETNPQAYRKLLTEEFFEELQGNDDYDY